MAVVPLRLGLRIQYTRCVTESQTMELSSRPVYTPGDYEPRFYYWESTEMIRKVPSPVTTRSLPHAFAAVFAAATGPALSCHHSVAPTTLRGYFRSSAPRWPAAAVVPGARCTAHLRGRLSRQVMLVGFISFFNRGSASQLAPG